jgi:hypothetical protein
MTAGCGKDRSVPTASTIAEFKFTGLGMAMGVSKMSTGPDQQQGGGLRMDGYYGPPSGLVFTRMDSGGGGGGSGRYISAGYLVPWKSTSMNRLWNISPANLTAMLSQSCVMLEKQR